MVFWALSCQTCAGQLTVVGHGWEGCSTSTNLLGVPHTSFNGDELSFKWIRASSVDFFVLQSTHSCTGSLVPAEFVRGLVAVDLLGLVVKSTAVIDAHGPLQH